MREVRGSFDESFIYAGPELPGRKGGVVSRHLSMMANAIETNVSASAGAGRRRAEVIMLGSAGERHGGPERSSRVAVGGPMDRVSAGCGQKRRDV